MIDFSNGSVFKLSQCDPREVGPMVAPLIIEGEQIVWTFKAVRDFVVFTNKRLIAVNVQGMTGKKKDFTSLPYSKIQSRSRPRARSIWTPNSICSSAVWARCASSSMAVRTSARSAT